MDKKPKQIPFPEESGTFQETERLQLDHTLSATPAQRLAWLEVALKFAYPTSALKAKLPE